jgi:hypothetical protein
MSNVQSYNALIDRFKAFASGHFILKRFSHGQIEVSDLEKFGEYPFMHVVPSNVTYAKGMKTFSFQIVLADLPRDKEDKTEYQREVLSDLQRIAEDLVAEITNHRVLFGDLITVNNVSLEPFLEEFQHTLTGWTISLDLLVPYYWDACSIPAEWNDMFESSTGGTGSILTFIDSITRDENGNVSLVNDEAEPAPNYYYGTNDEGVRGWYLLTDEVGLTCVTLPSCQTIIDIEAAIDLLQTDVTDLQSDVSSLETNKVPYTGATGNVDLGEFELKAGQIEFDQTPTGTAGVGVMRWNDTDGTVDVGLKGGNVTLQVGQESVIRVVNKSGSNLLEANYQAVRVRLVAEGGAQGQRLAVVLALADTDADSATTIGLVTETINNNQEGFVTTSGEVKNINTTGSLQGETWVDGDILYLSGTTSGRITNVKPSAPTHTIIIGYVVYAHANNGKIFVKVDNGYELDELHNVYIDTPVNNNVLTYESSTSLWKNKTVATALGYTPVPETRTLTINGTTQDLSANRTFTIATGLTVGTTPITSGTVGRVLFEGTGNVLQESANFFWDNTNSRLGIGTNAPVSTLHVQGSYAGGDDNLIPQLRFQNSNTTSSVELFALAKVLVGTGFGGGFPEMWLQVRRDSSNGGSAALRVVSNHPLQLWTNNSERVRIFANGNVGIGTTTDAGFRLDVNGTARVSGTFQSTYLSFRTADSLTAIYPTNDGFTLAANGNALRFQSNTLSSALYGYNFINSNGTRSWTTGTGGDIFVQSTYAPTSGSGVYNLIALNETINQTGGANGITRGLFVNPTLTAAADFRAIETTVGKVCLNTTSGNTMIGTTTDAGFKLDVNGTARVSGLLTLASSANLAGSILYTNQGGDSSSYFRNTSSRTVVNGGQITLSGGTVSVSATTNGANSDASAIFDVQSTVKGFLPPRMTTTQKNAIASPAAGLVVYDTTLGKLCVRTASAWETITSA